MESSQQKIRNHPPVIDYISNCRSVYIQIKATVVYRCSKVIIRLTENKSGLQTKTEGKIQITKILKSEENSKLKVPNQIAKSKAQTHQTN